MTEPLSVPTSVGFGMEGKFILPGETQEFKEYATAQEMIQDQPPKPDVPRYVANEEEFEKLKEKVKGVDIHAKIGRVQELEAEGKTFDEAFKIYCYESSAAEVANPIDLMSMAVSEDAGFPLDQMDAYDEDFKKMYEDMFSRSSEMGVMGAGDFEARLAALQNELSNTKVVNPNGGSIVFVSFGGSSVHAPQRPSTPFCASVPVLSTGDFVSIPEAGSYEGGAKVDDKRSGTPVDA